MTSFHGLLQVASRVAALTALGALTCCNCGKTTTAAAPPPQTYGYVPPTYTETTTVRTAAPTEGCSYYPTGRRESSAIQLCVTGPREVALNQPYTYNVQVTNLTQQHLANVVVRNVHDVPMDSGVSAYGYTPPPASRTTTTTTTTTRPPTQKDTRVDVDIDDDDFDVDIDDDDDIKREIDQREREINQAMQPGASTQPRTTTTTQPRSTTTTTTTQPRTVAQATPRAQPNIMSAQMSQSEWVVGHLAPAETKTITIQGEANQAGQIRQCLAVDYTPTVCTTLNVVNPQLQATIAGPKQALACDPLEYVLTVRNVGTGTARNVRVTGGLPQGLTMREGQREMSMNVGDLGPGQSREVRAQFRPSNAGEFTIQPRLVSDAGETQVQSITTVVDKPKLEVQVRGPQWQYIGQPIAFQVTVKNTGNVPANNTVLDMTAQNMSGNFGTRDLGSIAPGQSKTVDLNVKGFDVATTGQMPQEIRFNATARAHCADAATSAAAIQLRTITALLLETVDTVDPVQVGQSTVYQIAVRNQGSSPASNIRLVARLPQGLEFISATGDSNVRAEGQTLNFAPVQSLPAGATARWAVTARATSPNMVQFELELRADGLDEPAIETEPTNLFDPNQPPPNGGQPIQNPRN